MHLGSASLRTRNWIRRTRLLVEGLVLGGVQILLLLKTVPLFTAHPPVPLPPVLVGVLSACCYLVVSLSEGFLAASQTGKVHSGIATAWRVAGISVLPFALPSVVFVVLLYITPPENSMGGLVITFYLLLTLVDSFWAVLVSTLGGWMGGIVGHKHASRGNQSSFSFVEGLVLGGVQILLIVVAWQMWSHVHWSVPLLGVLSACCYLAVSLSEGFLAASRTGTIRFGIAAAWRVAGISVLPIVLLSVEIGVLAIISPLPADMDANNFHFFIIARGVLLLTLFASLWAWVWSTLGGWIGGVVGQRDARSETGQPTSSTPPPQGKEVDCR